LLIRVLDVIGLLLTIVSVLLLVGIALFEAGRFLLAK
jgi:hypothetical protein